MMGPADSTATHWVYASPGVLKAFAALLGNVKDASQSFTSGSQDHLWVYAHAAQPNAERSQANGGLAWLEEVLVSLLSRARVSIHVFGFPLSEAYKERAYLVRDGSSIDYLRLPLSIGDVKKAASVSRAKDHQWVVEQVGHAKLVQLFKKVSSFGHAAEKPETTSEALVAQKKALDQAFTAIKAMSGPAIEALLDAAVSQDMSCRKWAGQQLNIIGNRFDVLIRCLQATNPNGNGPLMEEWAAWREAMINIYAVPACIQNQLSEVQQQSLKGFLDVLKNLRACPALPDKTALGSIREQLCKWSDH